MASQQATDTALDGYRQAIGHRTVERSLMKLKKKGLLQLICVAKDRTEYSLDGLRDQLAIQSRSDVWYRPELRAGAPVTDFGAGAGLQNPHP